MHFNHFAYLAIELSRERTLEAQARHRYAGELGQPKGPGLTRRSLARAAAGFSRASASIARRLDGGAIEPESVGQRSTAT